jgi:hypothetical protein
MKAVGLLRLLFCKKTKSKYFLTIYQIAFILTYILGNCETIVLEYTHQFKTNSRALVALWTRLISETALNAHGI